MTERKTGLYWKLIICSTCNNYHLPIRRLQLYDILDIAKEEEELTNNNNNNDDNLVGRNPAVRAFCAILRCCQKRVRELKINHLAAEALMTPVAIRNALKRKV